MIGPLEKGVTKVVIFESLLLFQRFRDNETYLPKTSGRTILQSVIYDTVGSNCDWWDGDADTLTIATTSEITAFAFDWKYLYAALTIPRSDELKNAGEEAVFDLIAAKIQIAEMSLKRKLGIGLFSDGSTTPKSIIGLDGTIGDQTYGLTTYGGVARATYSWARSQLDATTTTLALQPMQSMYGLCTIGSEKPTLIVGRQVMFNRFWNRLQAQQRFEDKDTVSAGFTTLMFNGTPFVVDPNSTANTLYYLNEKYLYLVYHQDENFRFEDFAKPVDKGRSTAKIFWAGALVCSNPRMQGRFTALTS